MPQQLYLFVKFVVNLSNISRYFFEEIPLQEINFALNFTKLRNDFTYSSQANHLGGLNDIYLINCKQENSWLASCCSLVGLTNSDEVLDILRVSTLEKYDRRERERERERILSKHYVVTYWNFMSDCTVSHLKVEQFSKTQRQLQFWKSTSLGTVSQTVLACIPV